MEAMNLPAESEYFIIPSIVYFVPPLARRSYLLPASTRPFYPQGQSLSTKLANLFFPRPAASGSSSQANSLSLSTMTIDDPTYSHPRAPPRNFAGARAAARVLREPKSPFVPRKAAGKERDLSGCSFDELTSMMERNAQLLDSPYVFRARSSSWSDSNPSLRASWMTEPSPPPSLAATLAFELSKHASRTGSRSFRTSSPSAKSSRRRTSTTTTRQKSRWKSSTPNLKPAALAPSGASQTRCSRSVLSLTLSQRRS